LPVENVSWNDVQEFIRKLNQQTGKNYRLPTEAEWEFAARGGNQSRGYKYSGSNTAGNVAWYYENAGGETHPVGTKSPNELGIYDMSGNVNEWCSDLYGKYSSDSQTNPKGANSGYNRVLRGGGRLFNSRYTRVSFRNDGNPDFRISDFGFRLALSSKQVQRQEKEEAQAQREREAELQQQSNFIPMVYVAGGTFTMGCTSEQGSDCDDDESPAHRVTLSGYYIGKYEVTQAQWKAVMGSNPSSFKGDNLPVESVSWDDVQEFIRKLNQQTGKNYRLPTEAEWEFAARGGNSSRGYKYSGSNTVGNVAWYEDNSGGPTHPVGTKQANELGIYDMSGNVWEWCSDWYGDWYGDGSGAAQSNPAGPATGSSRVFRGGSWDASARGVRVSNRGNYPPGGRNYFLGFRLASSSK
jgi:formylglycine-generating enzyme required for sulfatase activity